MSTQKKVNDQAAEEPQSQGPSAFVEEIERRAEAEPDLDKRISILQEAHDQYPGEERLERSWRLTLEKRNLVHSIVSLARLYEQGGQFDEAFGEWQTLQIIYGEYPGLSSELERVAKLRDEQPRSEVKPRRFEDSDADLDLRSYARGSAPANEREDSFPGSEDAIPSSPREPAYQVRSQRPTPLEDEAAQPERRKRRRLDLDELERLGRDAEAAADLGTVEGAYERAEAIAHKYPHDPELQPIAKEVRRRLIATSIRLEGQTSSPPVEAQVRCDASGHRRRRMQMASVLRGFVTSTDRLARNAAETLRSGWREKLLLAVIAVATIIAAAFGAQWYVHRLKLKSPRAPVQPSAPPRASLAVLPLTTIPLLDEIPPAAGSVLMASETTKPKRSGRVRPSPLPTQEPNAQASEIANLRNLAREAYAKGNYVLPLEQSAIAYANRILSLSPNDAYARTIIEDSLAGVKWKVQQALVRKDFVAAHQSADALSQLLPGRLEVKAVQEDLTYAEEQDKSKSAHARLPAPPVVFSARVRHLQAHKAYCDGTLSISSDQLEFSSESASEGKSEKIAIPCSDIREIKMNKHILSHEYKGDFHLRTASGETFNFAPDHAATFDFVALESACSK